MPLYEYDCENCGPVEVEHRMGEHPSCRCGGTLTRDYRTPPCISTDAEDWSQENGGKGRYISQMASKQDDPNAFFQSRKDVHKECASKGWTAHDL
jgi:putative FmdB family regulatory protein